MNKLFLFDCDETLWTSMAHDYLSRIESSLALSGQSVVRNADGMRFTLRPGVVETFAWLSAKDVGIGIVSDNQPGMVFDALKLFGLDTFVSPSACNVRLWDGYCPKQQMVEEILHKLDFKAIKRSDVWWFDDKDYTKESAQIGVSFVRVTRDFDLTEYVRSAV